MMNILPFLHGDEESASALHYAGAFSFLLSASHVQSTVALNQAAADDNFEAGGALVVLWVSAAAALLSFGAWLASPYPAPPILRVLNLHLPFVNQGVTWFFQSVLGDTRRQLDTERDSLLSAAQGPIKYALGYIITATLSLAVALWSVPTEALAMLGAPIATTVSAHTSIVLGGIANAAFAAGFSSLCLVAANRAATLRSWLVQCIHVNEAAMAGAFAWSMAVSVKGSDGSVSMLTMLAVFCVFAVQEVALYSVWRSVKLQLCKERSHHLIRACSWPSASNRHGARRSQQQQYFIEHRAAQLAEEERCAEQAAGVFDEGEEKRRVLEANLREMREKVEEFATGDRFKWSAA